MSNAEGDPRSKRLLQKITDLRERRARWGKGEKKPSDEQVVWIPRADSQDPEPLDLHIRDYPSGRSEIWVPNLQTAQPMFQIRVSPEFNEMNDFERDSIINLMRDAIPEIVECWSQIPLLPRRSDPIRSPLKERLGRSISKMYPH